MHGRPAPLIHSLQYLLHEAAGSACDRDIITHCNPELHGMRFCEQAGQSIRASLQAEVPSMRSLPLMADYWPHPYAGASSVGAACHDD